MVSDKLEFNGRLGIYLRTLLSASSINYPVTAFLTATTVLATTRALLTTELLTNTLLFHRLLTLMLQHRICSTVTDSGIGSGICKFKLGFRTTKRLFSSGSGNTYW
jgi:hypothetical protein